MSSSAMIISPWIDALKVAAAHGFDAFEISCVYPSADPDNTSVEMIAEAQDIRQKTGMEICVHAPFFELNIAAFCQRIRAESVRIIEKSIDMCAALEGKVLIAHCGDFTYNLPQRASEYGSQAMAIQWNYNIESLKRINDYANSKGITVCLENIGFNTSSIDRSYEDLLKIQASVGDTLQFTFDMGHARLSQGASEGIHLLGRHIRHIHLTDNLNENDDHLPLGDGDTDYSEFGDFLKNFPYIITLEVIEISSDPAPVLRAKDAMIDLLSK
jgi:sugar phosphate isomerase/epimerase